MMSDGEFPIFVAKGERVEMRYVVEARLAVPLKQVPSLFIGAIHIREDWQEIQLSQQTREDFLRVARKYAFAHVLDRVDVSPNLFSLDEAKALQALCWCWLGFGFDKTVEVRIVQNQIKIAYEINGIKAVK